MSHMPEKHLHLDHRNASSSPSLNELEQYQRFVGRHIGPDNNDQKAMLECLGIHSVADLLERLVPAGIRLSQPPGIVDAVSEQAALSEIKELAALNQTFKSYIGLGYHSTVLPPVIQRNVLENPGWYSAYTPYQAEISQGRLEALLNFQTLTIELTSLPVASASLLDEATAAAEAMALAKRVSRQHNSRCFFVAEDIHPQTLSVLQTRAGSSGFELIIDRAEKALDYPDVFGVLLQQIGSSGEVHDDHGLLAELKQQNIITSVACDPMALVLLTPPDADVIFGSAQRFGVPMGYGGPHAAFFACREEYKRAMPGRIIGVSRDISGEPALRMALQTREQHIRREKATSNICTSQVLLANIAGFYAVYHGPGGLRQIAGRIHRLTNILAAGLQQKGFKLRHQHWFDTLTVETDNQQALLNRARQARLNLRRDLDHAVGISLDETTTRDDLMPLFEVLAGPGHDLDIEKLDQQVRSGPPTLDKSLLRDDTLLSQPVFNRYHSETEMMRYLHRLERRDLALNHSMIPLGSCTMKLNAAVELMPISWPEFNALHPFCPPEQAGGYRKLIEQLSLWLKKLTGFDAISMQPNSGAQGEYAGLLAIRRYHNSRGDHQRDICLVPASAHGTNPASAQMAGMSVTMVACDKQGNIDLADLREKAAEAADKLAAIMITYPSTHGVYESNIRQICDSVHQHGGQVYLDGANMNAQMGITTPALTGADVAHLNLHKTFCIPHGGGGPGMGPIGVKAHLAPFLPGHHSDSTDGAVSAAPFGSPSILPISWMYLRLLGSDGLRQCSEVAILNANYLAASLDHAYPVLYRGQSGLVAHECIFDLRPLKKACGVTEMDIAKRLMDYGFHAPTMSFPVPGTLMVEPTESETKAELDRFINAMLAIRAEIDKVINGEWPADNNPLVNAPHTQADLVNDWTYPYSREIAVFPAPWLKADKFWPSVKRLDDVFGDRNLFCACPPVTDNKAYE